MQKLKENEEILELVKKHNKREKLEKITMAQLLNHTSGISSEIFFKLSKNETNKIDGDKINYNDFFSLLENDDIWFLDNKYDYNNLTFSFAGSILNLVSNSETLFEEIIKLIPIEKRPTPITTYFNDKDNAYPYQVDGRTVDIFIWWKSESGRYCHFDIACGALIMSIKQACDIFCYFIKQYTINGRLKEIFEESQNGRSKDFASYSLGITTYYNDNGSVDFYSHAGSSSIVYSTIAVKPNGELLNCNVKITDPYDIILKCEIANKLNLDKLEDKQKEMIYKAIFDRYSNDGGEFDRGKMHTETVSRNIRDRVVNDISANLLEVIEDAIEDEGLGMAHRF